MHHSAIEMDGYRTLTEGQRVQFDVEQGDKGLQAKNVTLLASLLEAPASGAIAAGLAGPRTDGARRNSG